MDPVSNTLPDISAAQPNVVPVLQAPTEASMAAELRINQISTLTGTPSLLEAATPILTIGGLMAVYYYGIKMILTGQPQYPFKKG